MSGTIEPKNWKMLGYATEPICPIISAHTVKLANRYIECVKENCMWWHKCKPLEVTMENTEIQHGEWTQPDKFLKFSGDFKCSICGLVISLRYPYCPSCGAKMQKEEEYWKEGEVK